MKIKLIPKADYVYFKSELMKTDSGIVLPGGKHMDQNLTKNIVLAVGSDVKRCKVGDEIVVKPSCAYKLDYSERGLSFDSRIVQEENVIAVLMEIKG